MKQIYRITPMPKSDFNKVAKQVYWNHTSAWVFSCKFAAKFQNNFFSEHLRMTAFENFIYLFFCLFIFSVKWTLFFSLQKGENCWYSVFFQLMPWFCTHQFCLSIQSSEVNIRRCSVEKVILKILQNSQEDTCARVSYYWVSVKKETLALVFSFEFCKISKNTFYRTSPVAASESKIKLSERVEWNEELHFVWIKITCKHWPCELAQLCGQTAKNICATLSCETQHVKG